MKRLKFILTEMGDEEPDFDIDMMFNPAIMVEPSQAFNAFLYATYSPDTETFFAVAHANDREGLVTASFAQLANAEALREWMLAQGCTEDQLKEISNQGGYKLDAASIAKGAGASAMAQLILGAKPKAA